MSSYVHIKIIHPSPHETLGRGGVLGLSHGPCETERRISSLRWYSLVGRPSPEEKVLVEVFMKERKKKNGFVRRPINQKIRLLCGTCIC